MKFKTKRSSETGKKFAVVEKKADECLKAQKELAKKIGYYSWRGSYACTFGGVSSVIFKDHRSVNKVLWKNVNKSVLEWMPRLNNKEGKAIYEKMLALPRVSGHELNTCIDFNGSPFKTIGVSFLNKTYIGFEVSEDWKVKIPSDCEEITTTEYNKLFHSKK